MSREIIRTTDAPKSPPAYSQAVKAAGLIFVSGTGPHDPVTGASTRNAGFPPVIISMDSTIGNQRPHARFAARGGARRHMVRRPSGVGASGSPDLTSG